MPKTVNLGVIGWGNFFRHIHEQTLRDLVRAGQCRIRAVCVRSPDTRAAIAREHAVDYGTCDHRELLADAAIDAIIIGAPHTLQATLCIEALQAGKWVYVEKPMFAEQSETGRDPAALFRQLCDLGATARERLAVGLNKRFAPAYREIRRAGDRSQGLKNISISIVDDAWRWGTKYEPGFLMWLDACHWIDLARWFTGAEVERISCLTPQVEDSLVTMRMSNGSVAAVFLSGNGTMDMFKEELRVTTGARVCAAATDYVQCELFGGPRRELHVYPGNLQNGGDPKYVSAITRDGLEAFRAIRREMYERFLRLQHSPDPAAELYLKNNLPNFMRPQGWRESLSYFIESVAAARALADSAGFRDAYIAHLVVQAAKSSVSAGGDFAVPPRVQP
jgi:predicted dehydrogenase